MMMFFYENGENPKWPKMGNVQATPSHDGNTDNNDNYVEDDIDKKDNTGQLYPRNARFFSRSCKIYNFCSHSF